MSGNKSIALISCYFGELPWYFDYFIHSCKYNPSVSFFIITDDVLYTKPFPANVKIIHKTLKELSLIASASLDFEVDVKYGYKLCDFKPAYGLIFSDILKDFDFWGHCDIDIIFGDIREFITDELLSNYELISVRHDWLSGCFLLYKNIPKLNNLFLHSKDYKMVFTSYHHYCFDETNFAHDAFTEGKEWHQVPTRVESMMHVVKRLEAENYIKPFFEFFIIEGLPGKLRWENGKMFYRNKYEILLYHLIYFKKQYIQSLKKGAIPDLFKIGPSKIYHCKNPKLIINEF
jgi:hypothetical protein